MYAIFFSDDHGNLIFVLHIKGWENAYEFQWMDYKVILLLNKVEGMKSNKKSGSLFITISGKKLLEERDEDIVGLVVSNSQDEDPA